jgi:hypothetical protein
LRIWCGIDWSERHHDVALVDDDGVLIAKRRIPDSAAGFRQLLELLAEHSERSDAPIPVAIETAKGLLPAALRAAGYQLFPINPLAVARYRDRYAVSRAKSDPAMRWCWPTSCAPTGPRIVHCPPTASSPPASGCWPAPSKTRSGIANRRRTSCGHCCASTTPPCRPCLRI